MFFSQAAEEDTGSAVKIVRFRGDWSDTGPLARPEAEARQQQRPETTEWSASGGAGVEAASGPQLGDPPGSAARQVMERFTDIVSRWLRNQLNEEGLVFFDCRFSGGWGTFFCVSLTFTSYSWCWGISQYMCLSHAK